MPEGTHRAVELLDKHGQQLYRLLYRLTLSNEAAEELLQSLMCAVLEGKECWAADNPVAYVTRMAINLAFAHRKDQARRRLAEQPRFARQAPESPLQTAIRREEHESALEALSELSQLMQQCLVLRYVQHETHDAIASQLGKTAPQVRALCSKGLAELRAKLGAEKAPEKAGINHEHP